MTLFKFLKGSQWENEVKEGVEGRGRRQDPVVGRTRSVAGVLGHVLLPEKF